MLRRFLCVATLAMFAVPAQAGVIGSSELTLSNIKFMKAPVGANPPANVTGGFGNATTADFRISSITTSSANLAYLSGVGGLFNSENLAIGADGAASGGVLVGGNVGPNFSAPAAYVGPGATPAAGNRDPLSPDYVRSDSVFGGSFVQLINPATSSAGNLNLPFGGNGTTYADFGVDTAGLTGNADSTIDTKASAIVRIDFNANTTFTGSFSFDARSIIALMATGGLNPAYAQSASTSLSVTLAGVGANFSTGTADKPNAVNAVINLTGPGSNSYDSGLVSFNTGNLTFTEGVTYSLTILQNSAVAFNPVGRAVPEPASLAIFGCICVVGAIGGRRRFKKS